MMVKVYYWCFVLLFIRELLIPVACDVQSLECKEESDVSFECPCPGELNDCRFNKLFRGGYIVRDGLLSIHQPRYKYNEHKTHITLKECTEDDEGTYLLMCLRCNVYQQFHLDVYECIDIPVKCPLGGDISFDCPCCADKLDSCRFKKLEQEGYIVRDGVLSVDHPSFEFDEHKNRIILKECNEDDEGTYVFYVQENVNKQFYLEVYEYIDIPVKCPLGGDISFECPCCAEKLDSCRFKKLDQEGYIVRGGVLSVDHPRFGFDENKIHITLKECNEDDEGAYVFYVHENVNQQFHLEILHYDYHRLPGVYRSNQSATVIVSVVALISMILIYTLLRCITFRQRRQQRHSD